MPEELTAWLNYQERSFIIRVYKSLEGWTEEITEELIGQPEIWPPTGIHSTTPEDALILALTCIIQTA